MTSRTTICSDKMRRMLALAGTVTGQTRPETAIILRPSTVSDDAGGFVTTWAEVDTVSARVTGQGMQPWEKIDRIGDRVISVNVFLIALPAGTDVRVTDQIHVPSFGRTYEVIGVSGPSSFEVERIAQTVLLQ